MFLKVESNLQGESTVWSFGMHTFSTLAPRPTWWFALTIVHGSRLSTQTRGKKWDRPGNEAIHFPYHYHLVLSLMWGLQLFYFSAGGHPI